MNIISTKAHNTETNKKTTTINNETGPPTNDVTVAGHRAAEYPQGDDAGKPRDLLITQAEVRNDYTW